MIVEQVLAAKARKIKQFPVNSNRASDLGIPCVRYHVLNRTRWQERALHDVGLQMVFDMGSEIEEIVLKDLADAGIKVIEQQRAFSWPEYQITGHVDGFIPVGKDYFPLEIKSSSPFVFKAINSISDLTRGKYAYLRKYPTQLNLYLLMQGCERGVFLFKDKVSGQMKEIWMDLDYDMGEETLKRAEAVNAHVAAGTLPEPINDEMWCDGCAYAHICLPEHIGKEVEVDTGELAELLDRLEALKEAKKEYDEIDDQVKKIVEGREKILAGPWLVFGKWQERKTYDLPADLKAQYERITRFWRRSIRKAV